MIRRVSAHALVPLAVTVSRSAHSISQASLPLQVAAAPLISLSAPPPPRSSLLESVAAVPRQPPRVAHNQNSPRPRAVRRLVFPITLLPRTALPLSKQLTLIAADRTRLFASSLMHGHDSALPSTVMIRPPPRTLGHVPLLTPHPPSSPELSAAPVASKCPPQTTNNDSDWNWWKFDDAEIPSVKLPVTFVGALCPQWCTCSPDTRRVNVAMGGSTLRFTTGTASRDTPYRTWTIDMTQADFTVELFLYSPNRTAIVVSARRTHTTRLQSQTFSFSTLRMHQRFMECVFKYAQPSVASLSFQTKKYVPPAPTPVSLQMKRLTAAATSARVSIITSRTTDVGEQLAETAPSVLQLLARARV